MTKALNWKRKLLSSTVLMVVSYNGMAVTPGATQQAIESIPEVTETIKKPLPTKPGKPLTKKQRKALVDQFFRNKVLSESLLQKLKHPYYTDTPKSVFTPVGTPMRWGGMGIVGNIVNRYPSQHHNSYDTGISAALPFGNSETSIGGALSVGTAQLGPTPIPTIKTRMGQQGSVGLSFSRWLARSTMLTAGVANLIPWGNEARLSAKSYYGGVTQFFGPTFQGIVHPISTTIGLGSGGFTPIGQIDPNGLPSNLRDNKVAVFANASINLTPNLAVAGDYYSETFAVGIGYKTVIFLPASLMLYAGNLRHTSMAPSTTIGLRLAYGLPYPR